ncbi:MAG: sugar transferase [Pirellulaceae bacterium]
MIKRSFDLFVSAVALVLLSPALLVSAALVRFSSPGPVLFCQTRMGRGFQPFAIYKFRTMVQNAPAQGPAITVGADPRITRVGHILRATKLDELPQLWNVLKGDMSLVGPRPEVPRYVDMFRDDYAEVLRIRPGITDLASLKFRYESEILAQAADPEREYRERILPEKIALAKAYARDHSLALDLKILFGTFFALFRREPAASQPSAVSGS